MGKERGTKRFAKKYLFGGFNIAPKCDQRYRARIFIKATNHHKSKNKDRNIRRNNKVWYLIHQRFPNSTGGEKQRENIMDLAPFSLLMRDTSK